MVRIRFATILGPLAVSVLAVVGVGAGTPAGRPVALGAPPPEWAANPGSWPAHNLNLANTRATFDTRIDARDVATLKQRWTFNLPYAGGYGSFTSNPIVLDHVVYLDTPTQTSSLSTSRPATSSGSTHITRSRPRGDPTVSPMATGASTARPRIPSSRSTRTPVRRSGSAS